MYDIRMDECLWVWRNVFLQVQVNIEEKRMTPKQAFLAYVYPDNLPNLTRDISNEVVVNRENSCLSWPAYNEETFLPYGIFCKNEVLLLSDRYVVFEDNTVLKFD